ncbi:hypothetical protein PR048_006526 [Dryococelus australis]|uniref:Uncharacterized protein n=1 Tax=Dryococelus australis TaxID=614101 RepID=A0ABQ9IB73_9NEOP|nr:hypothetical protein PR048_006526 [Dryococelus australis]
MSTELGCYLQGVKEAGSGGMASEIHTGSTIVSGILAEPWGIISQAMEGYHGSYPLGSPGHQEVHRASKSDSVVVGYYECIAPRDFAAEYGFSHVTSSLRYAQSNGQVEAAIKNVKNAIKRSADPYLGLLSYRNTSLSDLEYSPAQLLMASHYGIHCRQHTKTYIPKLLIRTNLQLFMMKRRVGRKQILIDAIEQGKDFHYNPTKGCQSLTYRGLGR